MPSQCVLQTDSSNLFIKQRRRNKGKKQYQPAAHAQKDDRPLLRVREGKARFYINLWDYLDSGLFLDHRPVRRKVAELASGKSLLNLFCYTATATVQAALAGARRSISVDMSKTYLNWARKNFALNHINNEHHQLLQADCMTWIYQCRQGFDVILLDPPSFSNSKRMQGVLDIQRDHVALIKRCMELLKIGGTVVFSNNLRRFCLDSQALSEYSIKDITAHTLDLDFQGKRDIHHCWLIRTQ